MLYSLTSFTGNLIFALLHCSRQLMTVVTRWCCTMVTMMRWLATANQSRNGAVVCRTDKHWRLVAGNKSTDCTSRFTVHIGYRHYARRPLSVSFSSINLLFTTHWTFMFIALRISITLMPICFYLDDFCTYLILIIVHKFFFVEMCVIVFKIITPLRF